MLLALVLCCFSCQDPVQGYSFTEPFRICPLAHHPSEAVEASEEVARKHVAGRNQQYKEARGISVDGKASKQLIRQALAFISQWYPAACPSRGNLKQVFNFVRLYAADSERSCEGSVPESIAE